MEVIIKKLHISLTDRHIAGVCGGLAETFGVNAALIRIAFVILAFVNGIGLIAYFVLMIVLPKGRPDQQTEIDITPEEEKPKTLNRLSRGKMIAGICSGMERFFGIDVSIIRIAFIVVTILTSGVGLVLYIVLWLILPLEY